MSLRFVFKWTTGNMSPYVQIMAPSPLSSERKDHSEYVSFIIPPPNEVGGGVYWIHLVRLSVCPSVHPSVCRRHGFWSISQVCFGISISNFICMLMVAIGRSLLIFSNVTFKMAAWWPYWIFWFQTLTLVWLWISTPNLSGTILMYMCRSLLIFSNVYFKMAASQPYWNFWFPDSNFSLALNINCKLKWHNTYIYG